MSRWKTLPESLDPEVRRLVVRMRQLKDHSGLSLAALAAKTASSRSSWERYLNGKAVPPAQAVKSLARVAGTDPAPLLALWEVATRTPDPEPGPEPDPEPDPTGGTAGPTGASPGPTGGTADPSADRPADRPADPTADRPADQAAAPGSTGGGPAGGGADRAAVPAPDGRGDEPADGQRRRLGRTSLVSALAVVVIAAATALLAVQPWEDSEQRVSADDSASERRTRPETPQSTGASPTTYPCQFHEYDGLRYAGHSTTQDAEYGVGSNGEPIAEVQCLVRYHGFDPGPIDGIFGPLTTEAVKEFQRSVGLPADGLVGPMTWQALRDVS